MYIYIFKYNFDLSTRHINETANSIYDILHFIFGRFVIPFYPLIYIYLFYLYQSIYLMIYLSIYIFSYPSLSSSCWVDLTGPAAIMPASGWIQLLTDLATCHNNNKIYTLSRLMNLRKNMFKLPADVGQCCLCGVTENRHRVWEDVGCKDAHISKTWGGKP